VVMALHEGAPIGPHDAWTAWSQDPVIVLALAVCAVLYARGSGRLGARAPRSIGRGQAGFFWAGWAVTALALVSPLHAVGGELLWAHMAQHELLMVTAAPLLVLGRPLVVVLWGFPPVTRRRLGGWLRPWHRLSRRLGRVEIAWALHALAILAWHVPALYDCTVASDAVHALQHGSFLGTAVLFWWSVLTEARLRGRQGMALLSLFTTAVYTGGLGALLTVAAVPWYTAYGAAAPLWGLTPLQDQQLAGLIMWVPAGLSYLIATLWLMADWLRRSEPLPVRGPLGVRAVTDGARASNHYRS
jgi:putative membrane protein